MRAAAVIPAGGSGQRMAEARARDEPRAGTPKQYLDLGGEPMLLRALRPFLDHPAIEWVIVALPADDADDPPFPFPDGVTRVAGGATRGDSVRRALEAVPEAADIVLIHDGARPLLTRDVVDRVLAAVRVGPLPRSEAGAEGGEAGAEAGEAGRGQGAIAAIPVTDTIKEVGAEGTIGRTVPREGLWRAQTPQAFPRPMIADAYRRAADEGLSATDDAALVERYGGRVVIVPGDARNLKVTRPEDLALAELLLRSAGA